MSAVKLDHKNSFNQALVLAAELHKDQLRKGSGIPYMSHLMGVAGLAMGASVYCKVGSTTDIGVGALLHDAIEDQGQQITLEDIENKFGTVPAEFVRDCTDTDIVPKPPWKARKQAYIDSVAAKSKASQLVSAADKLHNARAILFDHSRLGIEVLDRFSVEATEVVWYYDSLLAAFESAWGDNPLLPQLAVAVDGLSEANS